MTRLMTMAIAAVALSAAPALASGGSGGGGGGGGGGSTSSCGGPTSLSVANTADGTVVAPYWQPNSSYWGDVVGRSSTACDSLPVEVRFTDTPLEGDASCAASIPTYRNPLYFKYGVKPPSRFESPFVFATGAACLGHPHSLRADMVNSSTGFVYGSMTITWTPA